MQRSAPDYNEAQWVAWAGGILAGLFSAVSLRVMAVGLASATNACGRLSIPTASGGTPVLGAEPAAGLPQRPAKDRIRPRLGVRG